MAVTQHQRAVYDTTLRHRTEPYSHVCVDDALSNRFVKVWEMKIKTAGVAVIACLGLSACDNSTPVDHGGQSVTGPARLDSGVNSSNGGGQRATGTLPGIGSNTQTGVTGGSVPAARGNSY